MLVAAQPDGWNTILMPKIETDMYCILTLCILYVIVIYVFYFFHDHFFFFSFLLSPCEVWYCWHQFAYTKVIASSQKLDVGDFKYRSLRFIYTGISTIASSEVGQSGTAI